MNPLGKIFVFLIVLFSVMLATMMIMAYAAHKNYRMEILRTPAEVRGAEQVGYKHQLTEANKEIGRLRQEKSQLELQKNAELAAKLQALAKAEATINLLSNDNSKLTGENAALQLSMKNATSDLNVTQANLSTATAEVKTLREQIAVAHNDTDKQIKRSTELTDKLTDATGKLVLLTERSQQLATDVSKAQRLLKKFGASLQDPESIQNIAVEGKITSVSRDRVQLSIGEDDGVRRGQNLDIYRSGKYVGRVRIVESSPDQSVAAIETEYQQYPIMRGDNVTSRL
jgi:chromosome segregation ATPase